jgi:hypothetical protein
MSHDTPSFTPEQITRGITLLHEIMPKARQRAINMRAEVTSPLARAVESYMIEDNLAALVIYPAPLGGWFADVMLQNVPPGVSNILGTPVAHPLATYPEALNQGIDIVALILAPKRPGIENESKAPPIFLYYGSSFALFPELLELLDNQYAQYPSTETAHARIKEITLMLFPDRRRPSYERLAALSQHQLRILVSVLHIASLTGVMRYPAMEPGMPGDPHDPRECRSDRPTETSATPEGRS